MKNLKLKPLVLLCLLLSLYSLSFLPFLSCNSYISLNMVLASQASLPENMTLPANNYIKSSPALVDFDGDGDNEIIVGSYDGNLYAWSYPGTAVNGWENGLFCGGQIFSSPAVADIDNDGQYEIAVGSWLNGTYIWQANGQIQPGWPQNVTGYPIQSSAAFADLDLDNDLEVIIGAYDQRVWVWHHDGALMNGWPQLTGVSNLAGIMATPAVANLDLSDETPEIIAGTTNKSLFVWHADGSPVNGFPTFTNGRIQASAAIGDLDGDGFLEIVVGTDNASLYAWNHDGTLMPGFPYIANNNLFASPALADIDKNGVLDIIFADLAGKDGGPPYVHVIDYRGVPLVGWPQPIDIPTGPYNFITLQSSPVVGDIDGDSDLEIVLGFSNAYQEGGIIAFHHNGQLVAGFPENTAEAVQSTPLLGDFAGDGDIEIIFGCDDCFVHVIDLSGIFNAENCPWPQFHYNALRSGNQLKKSTFNAYFPLFSSFLAIFVAIYLQNKKRNAKYPRDV